MSDMIEFYGMDKTNGNDYFFTHEISHNSTNLTYVFTQEHSGVKHQERVLTVSATELKYQVLNCNGIGQPSDGFLYSLNFDSQKQITAYDMKTYQSNSRTFENRIPKKELAQIIIPASETMIGNFGKMLDGLADQEKELIALLNNGQDIALSELSKPVQTLRLDHAA